MLRKKPCPLTRSVHLMPSLRLTQTKPSTREAVPYPSFGAAGFLAVSPAQTIRARDVPSTIRPCPKSTIGGQLAGRGGSAQVWCTMSQRAVRPMIMHPMLPDGLWKLGSATKLVGGAEADVGTGAVGVVFCMVALLTVAAGPWTVTVVVELPQPASSAAAASAAGRRRPAQLTSRLRRAPAGRPRDAQARG